MKINEYIKMGFSNLNKRKFRTFLTSFAVAIGVMLIITMVSLGKGVENLIIDLTSEFNSINTISLLPNKYEDLSAEVETNDKEDTSVEPNAKKITKSTLDTLTKRKDIEDVVVSFETNATSLKLNDKKVSTFDISAIDTNYKFYSKLTEDSAKAKLNKKDIKVLLDGRFPKDNKSNEIVVTESLMKKLGYKKAKDIIGKDLEIISDRSISTLKEEPLTLKAKIVGIVNKDIDSEDTAKTTVAVANKINTFFYRDNNYTYEKVGASNVSVNVNSADNVKTVNTYINKKLGYMTMSMEDISQSVKSIFIVIKSVLAMGGIIVLFVASLGVINTMVMSIHERTRSIGVMKAVGASKKDIKNIFLVESGVIGFIGGLMGAIFSVINLQIIKLIASAFMSSKGIEDLSMLDTIFISPLTISLVTILSAVIITILAGLYPSSKAAKLDPIQSLKYE
ncbi:MAG TPA: hypothetical protein DDY58_15130 [Terrisporobacter glycolicus]|uniref:ABC transporter permease YtrF n=1 Tax=Terrisporobacter petrolearius TaxID=1460447 RepID=A0ABZ3FKJ2_9FIRM|nr:MULTISPECIES: FtsX-like permease family protein [Terrisporobacter]MBN9647005.1 ABC transporter permease [Terrisporobacter glycolicus]HBI93634.1 hypothetical protein [Terrisporobacter hibernicus]